VITTTEAKRRQVQYDKEGLNYIMILREWIEKRGAFLRTNIDGTYQGSVARFCNHACSPTLKPYFIRINNTIPRVGLFAMMDIPANTELTFDYGISSPDNIGSSRYECQCGASNCRKKLPFNPLV